MKIESKKVFGLTPNLIDKNFFNQLYNKNLEFLKSEGIHINYPKSLDWKNDVSMPEPFIKIPILIYNIIKPKEFSIRARILLEFPEIMVSDDSQLEIGFFLGEERFSIKYFFDLKPSMIYIEYEMNQNLEKKFLEYLRS